MIISDKEVKYTFNRNDTNIHSSVIISPQECDYYTNHIESKKDTWHMAFVNKDAGGVAINTDIRNNWYMPHDTVELQPLFKKMHLEADKAKLHYGVNKTLISVGRQVLIYENGQYFRPHADAYVIQTDANGNNYWHNNTPEREFVSVLWLTEQTEIYEGHGTHVGGALTFPNFKLDINSKRGQMASFPSHPGYVHGVKKVLGGRRYSITNWWKAI
jgi:predicted 2-oxoglutarate/Fe(II)-dependent dioxygenase YbiX